MNSFDQLLHAKELRDRICEESITKDTLPYSLLVCEIEEIKNAQTRARLRRLLRFAVLPTTE